MKINQGVDGYVNQCFVLEFFLGGKQGKWEGSMRQKKMLYSQVKKKERRENKVYFPSKCERKGKEKKGENKIEFRKTKNVYEVTCIPINCIPLQNK